MPDTSMKIGELAAATNTPVDTIRFYEREGLLQPASRTASNYRVYGEAHVERLSFIRHCRSLDMALEEIRTLLQFKDAPGGDCAGVNALLDEHIGHVAARIRELESLQAQLRQLRAQCCEEAAGQECGILRELAVPVGEPARREASHVARSHPRV